MERLETTVGKETIEWRRDSSDAILNESKLGK